MLFFCIYYGIRFYDFSEDKKRRTAFRDTQLCASSKHGQGRIFLLDSLWLCTNTSFTLLPEGGCGYNIITSPEAKARKCSKGQISEQLVQRGSKHYH